MHRVCRIAIAQDHAVAMRITGYRSRHRQAESPERRAVGDVDVLGHVLGADRNLGWILAVPLDEAAPLADVDLEHAEPAPRIDRLDRRAPGDLVRGEHRSGRRETSAIRELAW